MTIRVREVTTRVQETLGLSEPDAATYVQLCLAGASKVSDLASALDVHRNDVYRSLDRLSARGLVDTSLERPARYLARDPVRAFDLELASQIAELDALKAERDITMQFLLQRASPTVAVTKTSYDVIQGRQQISDARRGLVEIAKREVLYMSTAPHDIMLADFDGLADAIAKLPADGPRVRALMSVPPDLREKGQGIFASPNVELRHVEGTGTVRFLVADGKELLMNVLNERGHALHAPDEVALRTTAHGLIEAETLFFEHVWSRAAPVRTIVPGGAS